MRILLSNDDGIDAPGLAAMAGVLSGLGELTVVAPAAPQSAVGQAITVRRPMAVRRVGMAGVADAGAWSLDGTPADCVRLAIRKLLDRPPDLVVSGINSGANVGVHVFYSGTVGAAAEGAICGVPAAAFSAEGPDGRFDMPRIASLCRGVLDGLLAAGLEGGDLINVNVPILRPGVPRGVRVGRQSPADVVESYHQRTDSAGCDTYELAEYSFPAGRGDNDVDLLRAGYITVTPLRVDRTAEGRLAELAGVRWRLPAE